MLVLTLPVTARLLACLCLPIWLSACATTTPPPAVAAAAPPQWFAPLPHNGTVADLSQWWKQLDDPLLVELIAAAQRVSPSVATARTRIEQARATRVAAGAALGPTLDASASVTRGVTQPTFPLATTVQAGLQAGWEVDLFGGNRAGADAAQARLQGAHASWHEARVSVAAEVANQLTALRSCHRLLAIAQADAASRAETARLTGLAAQAGFQPDATAALARASAAQGASLRTQNPPATGAWWRLDQLVAAKRKRNWTRLAAALAAIVLVLAVFAFVYARWLAPSPDVLMVISTLNDVEQLAMEQKWDEASAVVEEALQATPDDADLLIWAAVLAEQRGAAQDAARYLAEAERAVGDPLRLQGMIQQLLGVPSPQVLVADADF